MGKIRINKLALELNIQNDQILGALEEKGHTVKNYMSSIDEAIADEIRELFAPKPTTKKVSPKATKKVTTKKNIPKDQKNYEERTLQNKSSESKNQGSEKNRKKIYNHCKESQSC